MDSIETWPGSKHARFQSGVEPRGRLLRRSNDLNVSLDGIIIGPTMVSSSIFSRENVELSMLVLKENLFGGLDIS